MNLVKLQPGALACIDCGQAVDNPPPSTIVEKIAEHQQLWINGQPASTVQLPGPKVTQVARCIICTDTRDRAQALADRYPQVVHALGYDGYGIELISGALTALDALGINAQGIEQATATDRILAITARRLAGVGAGLRWARMVEPVLMVDSSSCAAERWSHLEPEQVQEAQRVYIETLHARVDGPRWVEPPTDGPRGCLLCGVGGVRVLHSKSHGVWGALIWIHDLSVLGGRPQAEIITGYCCPECRVEVDQYGVGPSAMESSLVNSMRLQTKVIGIEFPDLRAWVALPGNPRPNERRWGHVADLDELKASIEKDSEGRMFIG